MSRPAPDLLSDIRRMQEEIRQLRLRSSATVGSVEAEQSLEPYLGTGWTTYPGVADFGTGIFAPQGARFYKDRGRVYFAGLVTFDSGAPGYDARIPIASMPTGYTPAMAAGSYGQTVMMPSDTVNSPTLAQQEWWEAEVRSSGEFLLNSNKNLASATPSAYYPPDGTVLFLEGISYRHA